ncbi:hypothetical protein Bbelb_148100 [Branchiostoma belcheri]|nr:hypothetical protein Bbelb_148100 [Branchiostoma belcheri]
MPCGRSLYVSVQPRGPAISFKRCRQPLCLQRGSQTSDASYAAERGTVLLPIEFCRETPMHGNRLSRQNPSAAKPFLCGITRVAPRKKINPAASEVCEGGLTKTVSPWQSLSAAKPSLRGITRVAPRKKKINAAGSEVCEGG